MMGACGRQGSLIAERFSLLKYGLAIVLMFINAKMLVIDTFKIPVGLSLPVVTGIITASV
jgi:tellurite resistance protein TerC